MHQTRKQEGITFPKLRAAPQLWKNDPPESKSDVIENGQQKRLIMVKDGDNFLEQKAWDTDNKFP